jgi:uncharacterized integral membrane protein (TIGR00698 family)
MEPKMVVGRRRCERIIRNSDYFEHKDRLVSRNPLSYINFVRHNVVQCAPGVALCGVLTGVAYGLGLLERRLCGQAYLEALVLTLLLGLLVRAVWSPAARFQPGIDLSAKILLECAVVLLGAAVSVRTVLALGPGLLAGIAGVVVLSIALSYAISRLCRLAPKLALLVACGNSICGNSAIAAVAPVIGAGPAEITPAIAFTAVLGVLVVLLLPLLVPLLALSLTQYGVLAGLTVYAVPQVLAATLPIGALSNQVGTVVKLVRVLMLGPIILGLSLLLRTQARPKFWELVPWFIIGFLALLAARSLSLVPLGWLPAIKLLAAVLTTLAMAALGLGVDVRTVARAGGRVSAAVTLSLVALGVLSGGLIWLANIK